MIKNKKILKEEISEAMIRRLIRTEIAKIFFDLYRKRSNWENM
tara:strand:- start:638 stop:766 length:129 start_codon:yes stop_codon:yes gene_type:complete